MALRTLNRTGSGKSVPAFAVIFGAEEHVELSSAGGLAGKIEEAERERERFGIGDVLSDNRKKRRVEQVEVGDGHATHNLAPSAANTSASKSAGGIGREGLAPLVVSGFFSVADNVRICNSDKSEGGKKIPWHSHGRSGKASGLKRRVGDG
jgi:hypothetical protein